MLLLLTSAQKEIPPLAAAASARCAQSLFCPLPPLPTPTSAHSQLCQGGALELAEQIAAGESPDPDRIYLAVGSSCTISGLVVGVALSRHLGLRAYSSPGFRIVGVPIHHALAALQRASGFSTAAWAASVPLTVQHSVRTACEALTSLGGPDVLEEALRIVKEEVTLRSDANIVGTYGGHSEPSRAAAAAYEDPESSSTLDRHGEPAPPLWLCGHFVAKAAAALLADMEAHEKSRAAVPSGVTAEGAKQTEVLLLWQTKSQVQPRGEADEWQAMRAMPPAVKAWADAGRAESKLRPGSVDTARPTAEGHRHLMRDVDSP